MHLVDSDWIVDYLKGREEAVDLLHGLAHQGLSISVISYGEVLEGIYHGTQPVRHERDFRSILRWVDRVLLNKRIFEHVARTRGDLRKQGQIIGDLDLLIGLTAVEYRLELITRNVRHYARIPGLEIYRPD